MTKQELLGNYTIEQLADIVVELENELNTARNLQNEVLFEERIAENIRNVTGMKIDEVRKTLQNTKEYMNNAYIKELKDEINRLKDQLRRKEVIINKIDSIICELFGIAHNGDEYTEDFKKLLKNQSVVGKTLADFLPAEPIKVADVLIESFHEPSKASLVGFEEMFKQENKMLRQIAEHLLVYCNANGEGE